MNSAQMHSRRRVGDRHTPVKLWTTVKPHGLQDTLVRVSKLQLDTPLQFIKGVGPQRAKQFTALGLHTVADFLEYFPNRHERELGQIDIADLREGATVTVRGEVTDVHGRYPGLIATITDGTMHCDLRWFQRRKGGQGVYVGAIVVATGRVQWYNDNLEIVQPTIRIYAPDSQPPTSEVAARLVPVYPAKEGLSAKAIARVAENIFAHDELPVVDWLPESLRVKHEFPDRAAALRAMHFPESEQAYDAARRRLAYEELFLLELAMALRREKVAVPNSGQIIRTTAAVNERIRARFPFALTKAQDDALRDIVRDLQSGRPMTRLIQGDVGSGKTVVALYAALTAIASKLQAAIMAPSELLAQQHYRNVSQYLADSRVRSVLLTGALTKKQRTEALAKIRAGEIDLVIGTQAVIQKDVEFARLALVVVDEQHKFGVLQRAQFRTKGLQPHYLVMTATPIPRTLALTVFGDLDVSLIKQAPPGRGQVRTQIVTAGQGKALYEQLRRKLDNGAQAYVVCPLVEDSDKQATRYLISATSHHEKLSQGPWRDVPLGLLTGSMAADAKEATITAFSRGDLQAVISTTVVEVGVDVPTATIMVIENAERFGLAQLHQLRGRIGRGSRDGECYLVARTRSQKSRDRLDVMTQTTDGFRIAEADLKQRGPGEFFGTRQHGLPPLHIASIVDDFGLLEIAREDAFALVRDDPRLQQPAHRGILPPLKKMFGEKLALIDAA